METESNRARDQRTEDREAAIVAVEREMVRLLKEEELFLLRQQVDEGLSPRRDSTVVPFTIEERRQHFFPSKPIPPFDDNRDDMDAYIQPFERAATGKGWLQNKWALALSMRLTGEALADVGRMSIVSLWGILK